ncbi:MAG: glycosyltransferase [Nanoarchaeota archaeon]|mgnify:CR=1 FL=1
MMRVSVIIPVHNGAHTLAECLWSVLRQTRPADEVIVVDNNSTDETKDIIHATTLINPAVRYVFEARRSRGAARNAGINVAQGDIVAMTDADCIVPGDWLRRLTTPLLDGKARVVVGGEYDVPGNYWSRNIQHESARLMQRASKDGTTVILDTKNCAMRMSDARAHPFDPVLLRCQDLDVGLRLQRHTSITYCPTVMVGHHHKSTFSGVAGLQFARGYWALHVRRKHLMTGAGKSHPMLESMSVRNFLTFPFWMIRQAIRRPLPELLFLVVSETAWRAGVLWACIASADGVRGRTARNDQVNQ